MVCVAYRYSPRSCWYKLYLYAFCLLCFATNILDIIRVITDEQKYQTIWGFSLFSLVPFVLILTVICLQYYCRLMRYVKGESMVAQTIVLDSFRTKMVMEYKRACKLLLCIVLWNIVWIIGLIFMSVKRINESYLESLPFWIIFFVGNILHRIGFCYYLWIRKDPVEKEEFCIEKSIELPKDKSISSVHKIAVSNHMGVRM